MNVLKLDVCLPTMSKTSLSWDAWIGASKDDRVCDHGIPTRCHALRVEEKPVNGLSDGLPRQREI